MCSQSVTQNVPAAPPVAEFAGDPTNGAVLLTVTFTNQQRSRRYTPGTPG